MFSIDSSSSDAAQAGAAGAMSRNDLASSWWKGRNPVDAACTSAKPCKYTSGVPLPISATSIFIARISFWVFPAEERRRIASQRRRHLGREEAHAFARELGPHVAEVELDEEIPHPRLLDQAPQLLAHGLRAAVGDRAPGVELFPTVRVAEHLRIGIGVLEVLLPRAHRGRRHARPEGERAAFLAQVAFEAILKEVPDAFARLGARALVGLRDVYRKQDPHAPGIELAAVALDDLGEALRGLARGGAVRARGQEVTVPSLGHLLHGLDGKRARDPDRRMRALLGLGPDVHIAQREVPALVRERPILGPAPVDEVHRLPVARARLRLRNVIVERLGAAAHRKAGDEAP